MRGVGIFLGGVALSILLALWILRDSPTKSAPVAQEAPPAIAPVPKFTPPPTPAPPAEPAVAAPAPARPGEPPDAGRPDVGFPVIRFERPGPVIIGFDPKLWEVLRTRKHRLAYLSYARPVRDCIRSFMNRRQYSSWSFGGIARVRARIAGGVVSFPSVELTRTEIAGMPDRPPDDELHGCYQRAVQTLRVKCPECREGELEFSWKLRPIDWTPGSDGLGGWSDPQQDPQFSIESPPR